MICLNKRSYFYIVLLLIIACNNNPVARKKDAGMDGDYKNGSKMVTITRNNAVLDVNICFASENCIEPCFKGSLRIDGSARYTGWVHRDDKESAGDRHRVVVNLLKNALEISFPEEKQVWLGVACNPSGIYRK